MNIFNGQTIQLKIHNVYLDSFTFKLLQQLFKKYLFKEFTFNIIQKVIPDLFRKFMIQNKQTNFQRNKVEKRFIEKCNIIKYVLLIEFHLQRCIG